MGESMKFTELDQYLFGQGTNYEIYKKLGAHPTTYRRRKGVHFMKCLFRVRRSDSFINFLL